MSWSQPVHLYCERTDPSFWAEPLNTLTNIAFLIAALAAFRLWRQKGARDLTALALIFVTALVGLGSFTFHALATQGAMLADVIPIAIFVYGYLFLALRRFLQISFAPAFAILAVFIGVSQGMSYFLPDHFLNGSGEYLPPLTAMIVVGLLIQAQGPRRGMLFAALIFAVSLVFRTIDLAVCDVFPLGTHFVWHLLNVCVLYVLLRTMIGEEALDRKAILV